MTDPEEQGSVTEYGYMERRDDDAPTIAQQIIEWQSPKPKAIIDRRKKPNRRRGHRRLA